MHHSLIHMVMPFGSTHGWGVCGQYLALDMSRLTEVAFVTDHMEPAEAYPHLHDRLLAELYVPAERLAMLKANGGPYQFKTPVLQAIEGSNLRPWFIEGTATNLVGYTFFEKTDLKKKDVAAANQYFDWIVAGSTWCEEVLKQAGIRQSCTVLQGVDTHVFHSGYALKKKFQNHFVVFSGGKMEFRKGQDLVIRAFKVLQDKYDDVLLVNSWYNRWDTTLATMNLSPHIRFEMPGGKYIDSVRHLLSVNGIDPNKAIIWEPVNHSQVAEIYRNTDVGLFPNRCEGGTNLVLMEYMACGKPVIASFNTGQKDILAGDHAILLEDQRPLHIKMKKGMVQTGWYEPSLDELVSKLEWAYENRTSLEEIGSRGSSFVSELTWARAAREFHTLLIS